MVEFGQGLAGLVRYTEWNGFYLMRNRELSLQVIVPAFLLSWGMSTTVAALLTSALAGSLSFLAWGWSAYLFTRSRVMALLTPFLFVGYGYPYSHFYPLVFPIYFRIFGQVGTYLALICVLLWSFQDAAETGLSWGFLAGVHLPWSAGVLAGIGLESLWKPTAAWKRAAVWAAGSALVCAAVMTAGWRTFVAHPSATPRRPAAEIAALAERLHVVENLSDEDALPARAAEPGRRSVWQLHNQLISQSPRPWSALSDFLINEVLLALLIAYVAVSHEELWTEELRRFCRVLVCLGAVALALQAWQELSPSLSWAGPLGPFLIRVIPNRWLNLSEAVLPIFSIGLIAHLAVRKAWWPAWALLIAWLIWLRHPSPISLMIPGDASSHWSVDYFAPWMAAVLVGGELVARIKPSLLYIPAATQRPFLGLLVLAAAVGIFFRFKGYVRGNPQFWNDQRYAALGAELRKSPSDKAVILSFEVPGMDGGLNLQTLSGRSYYRPWDTDIPLPKANPLKLDCFHDPFPYISAPEMDAQTRSCFEKRKTPVWQFIGEVLSADEVLTDLKTKLNLPLVKRFDELGLQLYAIPAADARTAASGKPGAREEGGN